MTNGLAIVLLAAGASRRMRGRDKLLEEVEGEPILRRVARRCVATGLPVLVALPPMPETRWLALAGLTLVEVTVADPSEGMAASLRAAIAAVPQDRAGAMVVLADMPEIETTDYLDLAADWARSPERVLRACDAQGTPGQPVILPRRLFGAIARLRGDAGAREMLRQEDVRLHALPGDRATTDLDTPEAWAAWRSSR